MPTHNLHPLNFNGIRSMKTLPSTLTAAAVTAWLALGCGQAPDDSSQATPPSLPPISTLTAAQLNDAVRDAKSPAVILNMWATWCVPCIEELPDLLRLHENYRARGVKLFLVSWDADPKLAQKFLASKKVDFPSFIKDNSETDPKFIEGIEDKWSGALPATFLFDADGKLVHMWEGKETYEAFEKKLLEILKPSAQNPVQPPKGETP